VNVKVPIGARVAALHWLKLAGVVTWVDNPFCTNPTVGVGFEMSSEAPLIEKDATTGVAPKKDPPPNTVALTRAPVMRIVRVAPVVAGARIGIPKNVTEFPLTMPWNTFGAGSAVTGLEEATGSVVPAGNVEEPVLVTVCTYSMQPVDGVGHRV